MFTILKENKILFIVLMLIIAGFVWFGMADRAPLSNLLTTESAASATPVEQEIMRFLLDMRSVELDSSIFEDPAFQSLQDFGQSIVPEPVGRENPFKPAEGGGATQADQAAGAAFE